MDVTVHPELVAFTPMPTEQVLYMAAIRHKGSKTWSGGFADTDQSRLINTINGFGSAAEARIYSVRLPIVQDA